jgi:hypothetical protein
MRTPSPRSLRTVKGVRLELTRLYGQGKRGEVDPALLGKLVHLLSTLAKVIQDSEFEVRLEALERTLEDRDPRRPNGRAGRAYHARP